MRSTTTTLRAEWPSADESSVLAHCCLSAWAAALGWRSRVKTPLLFPPTRMDSGGGGGEVGEVPRVLADDGLDAVETRWFMSRCAGFVPPRLPATTECRGGIGSAPTGWPITSTRPAPAERRAPRRSSSAAAVNTAPTTSTPSPRREGKGSAEASTCRIVAIRSTKSTLTPRFCLNPASVGHRAVHPREVPSPAGPRDPQDLDWSRESSASQRTSARMRSAKKTLCELCTAIPIQALR
jgi:hypothetical protein